MFDPMLHYCECGRVLVGFFVSRTLCGCSIMYENEALRVERCMLVPVMNTFRVLGLSSCSSISSCITLVVRGWTGRVVALRFVKGAIRSGECGESRYIDRDRAASRIAIAAFATLPPLPTQPDCSFSRHPLLLNYSASVLASVEEEWKSTQLAEKAKFGCRSGIILSHSDNQAVFNTAVPLHGFAHSRTTASLLFSLTQQVRSVCGASVTGITPPGSCDGGICSVGLANGCRAIDVRYIEVVPWSSRLHAHCRPT
ncbi:hypothetical protein C8Q77DRAFT_509649 [Trametes polyzona]|nr:hypothetical protein C8Q77DRAFT_509649 [Trametes polyzona]